MMFSETLIFCIAFVVPPVIITIISYWLFFKKDSITVGLVSLAIGGVIWVFWIFILNLIGVLSDEALEAFSKIFLISC